MTWSYVAPTTDLYKVRFLIGDTDSTDQLLMDEEVNYLLSDWIDLKTAASVAAETIAAKFSREADKSIGDLKISMSERAKAYRDLSVTLRASANKLLTAYAGGISKSDKDNLNEDTDKVMPSFSKGLFRIQQPDTDQRYEWI